MEIKIIQRGNNWILANSRGQLVCDCESEEQAVKLAAMAKALFHGMYDELTQRMNTIDASEQDWQVKHISKHKLLLDFINSVAAFEVKG